MPRETHREPLLWVVRQQSFKQIQTLRSKPENTLLFTSASAVVPRNRRTFAESVGNRDARVLRGAAVAELPAIASAPGNDVNPGQLRSVGAPIRSMIFWN